jgi:crotonobetainyl-CoA:carnitine CoA-transferase CaiB-like acyl-CoA transferase
LTTLSDPPLVGIRVVELTTAWAGPLVGRILAFLGAEVVHVESPTRLNSWRAFMDVPNPVNYPAREPGERPYDRAYQFNSQNINKHSLALDMKKPGAREALSKLIANSDVLTCNFRPGTLEKLGFGYEQLRTRKPDIIVLEMPAFGRDGPMSGYAALGPTMEMATGMSSLIGYPEGAPTTTGPSYMDPVGGYHGAAAVMTALLHRQVTGEGQHIEMPQVEAAMQFIGEELISAAMTGTEPTPLGNHVRWAAPHDAFAADGEDEWVALYTATEAEWQALCATIGQPSLPDDPSFATLAARLRHQDKLRAPITAWTRRHSKHTAAEILQAAGVPAAPVQNASDVATNPYLRARDFFTPLDHPVAGRHEYPTIPIRLSRTPGSQHRAAPGFGEHNLYILKSVAGLTDAEIAALAENGAISATPSKQTAIE